MILDSERELRRILASRAFLGAERSQDRRAHLAHAISQVSVDGLWLEFGVGAGNSTACITALTDRMLYGFDWFQGLPEAWVVGEGYATEPSGAFKGRPSFERPNLTLVEGLFQETLPAFLRERPGPVAFIHVDCDLYSSTSFVLGELDDRLVAGSVIVLDDLFNYPNYGEHEMKALLELASRAGLEYEYLGHTPQKTAASLRITAVGRSSLADRPSSVPPIGSASTLADTPS